VFFRETPLKHVAFLENNGYLPAGCLRHNRALAIIIMCYILWRKSGTMLISQCESRMGKEKVIANEEKGRRGHEKDANLRTASLMCRLSPRFQKKKQPKRPRGLCRTPPPPPWFDVVLQGPPPPLTDHVV